MHKRIARASVLAAAAAALTFAVSGCSDSGGDEAACKEAIAEEFKKAQAGKDVSDDRPSECEGISDETGERLVEEVTKEEMKGLEDSLDAP
ncbi:hypothetical protein [Streptomyces sp. MAR4 CNX-425]|uniref:hypothetical protein n=1 Tax=Streptomyces sp. MAR4 CNX-425 TaxID=3406343 RepID=UPI003B50F5BF